MGPGRADVSAGPALDRQVRICEPEGLLDLRSAMTVVLIALAGPQTTAEQGPDDVPIDLAWKVPASCPDLASERAEIRGRIGALTKRQVLAPLAAEVEIREAADGTFRLSLRTRVGNTTGERALEGPSCKPLAEAVALVLALLVNPDAGATAGPPAAAGPALAVAPPAAPDPASSARFALGVEGAVAGGLLPGVAWGPSLRFFFQHGPALLALRAGAFLPKEASAPVFPGARASFYLLESALALCARTSPARRAGAMACIGAAVMRLHGESTGVSAPGEASATWLAGLAEVGAQVRLTPRTRLRIGAEVDGLGDRPDFAILGLGGVFRPSALGLRAALGMDRLF